MSLRISLALAALIGATAAPLASAQTSPPSTTPSATPSAAQSTAPAAGAPMPGANSFTETQITDRLIQAGYTSVSGLRKDDQGVWRGSAAKSGKTVAVAVDFKGNIVETQ